MSQTINGYIARFRNHYLDARVIFAVDMLLSLLSSFAILSFVSFASQRFAGYSFPLIWLASSFAGTAVALLSLGTSRIIIRHTTFKDMLRFIVMCLIKIVFMGIAIAVLDSFTWVIYLMLALDMLVTLVLVISVRLVMIGIYDTYKSRVREVQSIRRILVYGISNKSKSAVQRLSNSRHYEVVGVICPDLSCATNKVNDKPVYAFGSDDDIEKIFAKTSSYAVLFARREDLDQERNGLVQCCTNHGIKVLMVPTIEEFSEKQMIAAHMNEVKIEDLLGRPEIKISLDAIRNNFCGKTVMVTGAAGSIGSELCRQLAGFNVKRLVLFDNAETPMHNLRLELEEKFPGLDFVPVIGDVRLVARLDFAFRTYRPQVVFHAAAYKHVPLMEENPCEAVLVNVAGSRNVADKCIEFGIEKMVMISTDKAVNPTNIMGCTKRLAEIYVQSLGLSIENGSVAGCTKFVTTRFGNVLGSNGSVIPRFRHQIELGGPVTVTHPDITRFFMTIPEACRLVMEAATMPTENRICVFDMGDPVKIDVLARRMIKLSGLVPDKDIEIKYTGLRPGEKLYEEVLSSVENTDPTSHDRIRIAHVRSYEYQEVLKSVEELERFSREVNIPDMVRLMKKVVPEYISNNSRFSEYDK